MKIHGSYKILITVTFIIILVLYFFIARKSGVSNQSDSGNNKPVALVKIKPIQEGTITERITAYGITIPAPGAVQTVSVQFESQIRKVMITDGQSVSSDDALLEIDPSPDSLLQLEEAKNNFESSKLSLEHIKRLFNLQLATNDQVTQANQAFRQAELNLKNLRKRGINGKKIIYSDITGLIKQVNVKEGEIIPAGGTLVEIVLKNRMEARLGIEPEDIGKVKDGQEVLLSPINDYIKNQIKGKIRKISGSINPDTHLVDAFVSISEISEESKKIYLGEFIAGKINVADSTGLIVPISAVLPKDSGFTVYTVRNNTAFIHWVQKGLENEKEVEIRGKDIRPGDPVVVLGNYELEDGMSVKVDTLK